MELNRPEIVAQVEEQFWRYERALVDNDVAVLDELFWDNDRTVRFGVGENLYGYPAIRHFRADRSPVDLARDLLRVDIATFGSDVASVSCEFRRRQSGVTGRQQQTWVRITEGWRIVAAHVSVLA